MNLITNLEDERLEVNRVEMISTEFFYFDSLRAALEREKIHKDISVVAIEQRQLAESQLCQARELLEGFHEIIKCLCDPDQPCITRSFLFRASGPCPHEAEAKRLRKYIERGNQNDGSNNTPKRNEP